MNKELAYWVATSAIPGVGSATFNYLLRYFKRLQKFWEAPDEKVNKLKLDAKTREAIIGFRQKVDPKIYLQAVYERGIKVVSLLDRDYPANLRQISDAPPVLYYKGSLLPQDDLAIAVVGARYATVYGRQVTEGLVLELVNAGLTIISGLARGIDSIAHRAAIDAGGRTIAVLGSGVDLIYPPENKSLAEKIVQNGAVVSEFPLGFPSVPSNFPARNRIISGLSLGVLVTEAAVDSGSLITAGCAAEQGREVFAVPGPVNIERKQRQQETRNQKLETKNLTKEERKILELLDGQSKHIDIIVRESGLEIDKVSAALSMMEIRGFVKNYGLGMWET